ncbi:hypothetical protein Nepgr_014578 [Nepenthes gracilis]|uniref:PUM-HD domain-containing protein n=1 Tax=Nepenthes gracilis TaxID=150966 RepID=A0AAD3SLG3_NEPGR|nr:hypothetical protein Nepgr_014578 [Nepenthes gracilis]
MPMIGANEGSFGDDLEKEIGLLVREQRRRDADERERELNLYRSGSAPPTVEGSLSAVGGLFGNNAFPDFDPGKNGNNGVMSEEELRSDPAYLSYYYSNANLNPRLPPPILSKEDWRFAQRLQGGSSVLGGIGDRRKPNRIDNGAGRSLFSMPPGFTSKKEEREVELEKGHNLSDWAKDGLIGLPGIGLGSKRKSLAEIFQDDLSRSNPTSRHPSRPVSRNAFDENIETLNSAEANLENVQGDGANIHGPSDVLNVSAPTSYTYAAALGASLSRSTTPDPHVARAPSPHPTPTGIGTVAASEKRAVASQSLFTGVPSIMNESADLVAALSGMNLSTNGGIDDGNHFPSQIVQDANDHNTYLFNMQRGQEHVKQYSYLKQSESAHLHGYTMPQSTMISVGGPDPRNIHAGPKSTFSSGNSHSKGSPHYTHLDGTNSAFSSYGLNGYSLNPALSSMMASQLGNLPPLLENVAAASAISIHGLDSRGLGSGLPCGQNLTSASESLNIGRMENQMAGYGLQASFVDPMYLQYLRTAEFATQVAALSDESSDRSYVSNSYVDLLQKAYMGSLLSPQKSQYGVPLGNKSSGSNHGYYGNHAFGVGMGYPGSPMSNHVIPNSPAGPGSPIRHNEFNMRFPGAARNLLGGVIGPWHIDGSFGSSLLEEFKSNKTKSFELSIIAGHVVEFSADQYGSRFIQQKLETATTEEKNMVFKEIFPHAHTLMTDVFGNYVIQKFFEHGMPSQRKELAGKLDGHVLTLSLQMYGCRVIQKAIEAVDLDQKIKMVQELDGHVMLCVRDQNGNHVIQKCIECVPEEHIQFIVQSFFDQVVTLSTHPYGCRVIQRVLEHCKDPRTQTKVMDEILDSVSMLAQDQYGNYVIQHVLEHGKPHERSTIIKELAGKIVLMSQQKFASNVVEKCLAFGGPDEREFMVKEMLGTTDENEPLQAMMKDQFANYVVQKVLETCSDQQRELILSRIKVHLNALKKYTYGKHIVARVEKLVAAGERRIAGQSQHRP